MAANGSILRRSAWFAPLAALLLLFGGFGGAAGAAETRQVQDGEQPIEVLIVQGIIKSVDVESLVLTAPGAPHDLPLRLHPETRYIQGEADVKHEDLEEGQVVRAALIPMGEDLVAVVVEIVPDEEMEAPEQEAPTEPGEPELDDPGLDPNEKPRTTDL